jgi:hypothetical protein
MLVTCTPPTKGPRTPAWRRAGSMRLIDDDLIPALHPDHVTDLQPA